MLYIQNQKILTADPNEELLPAVSTWTSLLGLLLMMTVGSAIALSAWIKYDVVVRTAATIRPVGDVRVVQPEIEGTIESVLVTENQIVKQGDAIARLDTQELQIKQSLLQSNIQQGKLQLIQIDAQISTLETQIIAETRLIERTIAAAQADFSKNQRDFQEKQITTESEYLAAVANLQKARANLQKAQADLNFAEVDRDRYQQLTEIGAIGRREYEQKKLVVEQSKFVLAGEKQAVEIAQTQLQSAKAAINPSMATVAIASERIAQERARGEASIATLKKERQSLQQRQVEIQAQITQYDKELQQISRQLQSSIIHATSDGVVLKLNLRNPGQVVRASEAIAEIVPHNTPLIVKAMIPTADIKKVAVGQKVQLRVNACPYPDYGTLQGQVKAISPDSITPQRNDNNTVTPSESYFEATIQPKSQKFGHGQQQCQIQSGMNADANIISQQETSLQFILRKARLITDL